MVIRRVLPALLACALGAACADVWGFKDITASGDGGSDTAGNGADSGSSSSGLGTGGSSATTSSGASSTSGSSGASSGGDSGTSSGTGGSSASGSSGGSSSGAQDASDGNASSGGDGGHEAGTTSSSSSGTSSGTSSGATNLELIDDMESMNGILDGTAPGLTGNWFEYNDGTGTQNPAPMGAGKVLFPTKLTFAVTLGGVATSYVMSTNGSGFTTWGAGIGFNFKSGGGAYDVSAYSGVLFYAQVGSAAVTTFRFDVPTQGTSTTGGVCNPSGTCGGSSPTCCGDHYGYTVNNLSTSWKEITIPFTELAQQGYGLAVSFDKTEVYGCDFVVAEDTTFNFSIADVYFTTP